MNKEKFVEIIDATPLVSMDLIIENKEGKILLGKRKNRPAQGFWFVPGGRIRKNETLDKALDRISQAELGIEINMKDANLIGAFDHIYEDNFAGIEHVNTHYVAMGYKVVLSEDFLLKPDDQHSEMAWWSKQDLLLDSRVHENTKRYF